MKKLNRKLIPAFAMLLLSAVLMSTASFAWFASNTTVSATGMHVTATTSTALWISTQKDADFTTTIELEGKDAQIEPVTTILTDNSKVAASEWVFHKLTPAGKALVNQSGQVVTGTAEAPVTKLPTTAVEDKLAEADGQNNVLVQKFYLRLEGKNDGTAYDAQNITANVTLTSTKKTEDKIYQALRVAIVTDGAVDPATGGKSTKGTITYEFDKLGEAVKGSKALTNLVAQETVEVYVYIWFEGEDSECRSDYSQSLDTYNVSLEFVQLVAQG